MQYMLLIYADEAKLAAMPTAELPKLTEAYWGFTQEIVKTGHFRAGAQLQPTSHTTTVRDKGGKRLVTDGPFAEAKEHLAGYYLVECENLDEAIGIADRIPGVRLGHAVEIRPIKAWKAATGR
jgi:hypothetical protein